MERLRDLKEAAGRVGVSPFTLRRWAKVGKVGVVRLSTRAIRFREADLEKLVQAHLSPAREQ